MLRTAPLIETEKVLAPRETADGSPATLPLYIARPAGTPGTRRPALLVVQEIFGVNPHIQDVTRRFAANGYVAVAPDIFHRSGHWISLGYDQMSEGRSYAVSLTEDLVTGDLKAAFDHLAAQPDVDPERMGVVGYCFGGRMSFVAAARLGDRVKASATYYGGGIVSNQPGYAPVDRAQQIKCPVIAFYGALDRHIPREHVERLENALAAAGVDHKVYYYPEADHGFFCDARAAYNPRCAQDAWHRTLWFFGRHLGPAPAVNWE